MRRASLLSAAEAIFLWLTEEMQAAHLQEQEHFYTEKELEEYVSWQLLGFEHLLEDLLYFLRKENVSSIKEVRKACLQARKLGYVAEVLLPDEILELSEEILAQLPRVNFEELDTLWSSYGSLTPEDRVFASKAMATRLGSVLPYSLLARIGRMTIQKQFIWLLSYLSAMETVEYSEHYGSYSLLVSKAEETVHYFIEDCSKLQNHELADWVLVEINQQGGYREATFVDYQIVDMLLGSQSYEVATLIIDGSGILSGPYARNLVGLKVKSFLEAYKWICDSFGYKVNWAARAALRIAQTFGKSWKRWAERIEAVDIYDAALCLSPERAYDFGEYLFSKGKHINYEQISTIARAWPNLTEEHKKLKPKDLLPICRTRVYKHVQSEAFALECAKWSIAPNRYTAYERRWIASLKTPVPFPSIQWKSGSLKAYFLKREDPRGLMLGHYTNCCQHPENVGATCAWYGQESPDAGFFVVESSTGEIIAQSFTWITTVNDSQGTYQGVCFDNVEAKGISDRWMAVQDLYEQAARCLANSGYRYVTMGCWGDLQRKEEWKSMDNPLPLPRSYSGYTDAEQQVLLAENTAATQVSTKQERVFVRGLVESDLEACTSVAQQCYGEAWAQEVSLADEIQDTVGLVLVHVEGGTVGYLTADIANRYVCDLAVLPKYRRYTMHLVNQFIAQYPGEWEADLMPNSLRLLRKLAQRGLIELRETGAADHTNRVPVWFKTLQQ